MKHFDNKILSATLALLVTGAVAWGDAYSELAAYDLDKPRTALTSIETEMRACRPPFCALRMARRTAFENRCSTGTSSSRRSSSWP